MSSRKMSKKIQDWLCIYRGVLVLTLMYGDECSMWQRKQESKIDAVKMRGMIEGIIKFIKKLMEK